MECSRCHKDLPVEQFRKHSRRCHRCLADVAKEYRLKNPEKYLKCLRTAYRKYRDERLAYAAEYYKRKGRRAISAKDREWLDKWKRENRIKINAKARIRYAVKSGKLTRPDRCSVCNQKRSRISGHHPDYAKPLEVAWVCDSCHREIHLGSIALLPNAIVSAAA